MSHKREMKVSPIRRNYKDTVFRRIFNDKENLLALYNALNQTNYKNSDDIEIITLDNALFLKMKNDIAFLINTTLHCSLQWTGSPSGAGDHEVVGCFCQPECEIQSGTDRRGS